jgi:hypothetical protein
MKRVRKRRFSIEEEIERFCQGAAEVLNKIHERIEGTQTKKQRKRRKATA